MRTTDVRICAVRHSTEDYRYRTPIKFGGVALDRVTLLNVEMDLETGNGRVATGYGSMPLGNVWAWPSRTLKYDETLQAMVNLAAKVNGIYTDSAPPGHPVEITHGIEEQFFGAARESDLPEVMPRLATMVVASAFDAALHDGYGKAHQLNCYRTYGPDFLPRELSDFLGEDFRGDTLNQFVSPTARPTMPLYHLVGALDPLTPAEVQTPVGDGLPEHLGEWIETDGLTHLKIKLNGDELAWDVARVVAVNAVAEEVQTRRGILNWYYSLDFNERCQNVEYLLAFLEQVKAQSPLAFDRVQYVEQPTARDLKAYPNNKMHAAAKWKPVVIDESLLDWESLLLARDMGYTGVAFKACKGQTQTLLLAAAAQKLQMFRCVQDLTCPGASLIHSAGIAAHIPGVAAIEANSRQYCPAANKTWESRYPGVFITRNGQMNTAILDGVGLST